MRWISLVSVVALLAACASSEMVPGSAADMREWNGELEARMGHELRAAVRANSIAGSTAAVISVADARSGAVHPWHIHRGTCGSGGPVVGAAAAYRPLRIDGSGNATARARLDTQLDPMQSYYVNIHESPQNPGNIIACGTIR